MAENLSGEGREGLLKAMISYGLNRFPESNSIIRELFPDLDPRSQIIAMAVVAANHAAMDNYSAARDAFMQAYELARQHEAEDLVEELARLHGRMARQQELGIAQMQDYLARKGENWCNAVAKARFIHNLGVQQILVSRGQVGLDLLAEARTTFEQYGLSFAAYSAVSQAVAYMARHNVNEAVDLLLDAKSICRDSYERFGVDNNLGICFALCGKLADAAQAFQRAADVLYDANAPLEDPLLRANAHHNLAAVALASGDFEEASAQFRRIPHVKEARHNEFRLHRQDDLGRAILQKNRKFPLSKPSSGPDHLWYFQDYNLCLMTLSFYDFPFTVLSQAEVDALAATIQ